MVILIGTVFNINTQAYAATAHHHQGQDVTAYTGSITGHGATYGWYNQQYKTVAVHKYSNNNPYIPFGTPIITDTSLYLNGSGYYRNSFTVTDTGVETSVSPYWLDIYYGNKAWTNDFRAKIFGKKSVSYHAYFLRAITYCNEVDFL